MIRILVRGEVVPGRRVEVVGEELHYLLEVRRARPGDPLEIRDSSGRRFAARVSDVGRGSAAIDVSEELPPAPEAAPVTLAVAVPKRNLLDDVVRKASEIGVAEIWPAIAARTVGRPDPARVERWRRIAAESMRQCGRRTPVVVREIAALGEVLEAAGDHAAAYLIDPSADEDLLSALRREREIRGSALVAVGPEGGFTPEELESAREKKFTFANIGKFIMRIETAGIVASCLTVSFMTRDDRSE